MRARSSRRTFLLLPFLAPLRRRRARMSRTAGSNPAACSAFRAIMAATPNFARSGGTSPAGLAMRLAMRTVCRSPSSATAPVSPRRIRAPSRHVSSCSRMRRWPIRAADGSTMTSARRARASAWRVPTKRRRGSGSTTGRWRSPTAPIGRGSPRASSTLDLAFAPTHPLLLHGAAGYSRKGPAPGQASYYYSQPQLRRHGHDRARARADRGVRYRVARSRVVERGHGVGGDRLGLDRDQSRRWRSADGVPDAQPDGRNAVGRRDAARSRTEGSTYSPKRTCVSRLCVPGARPAPASRTRSR